MVEGKKGLPVGPSVGPLALDDKQKAQLLTLIQTFTQLDPAGRRRLLRAARELASKIVGQVCSSSLGTLGLGFFLGCWSRISSCHWWARRRVAGSGASLQHADFPIGQFRDQLATFCQKLQNLCVTSQFDHLLFHDLQLLVWGLFDWIVLLLLVQDQGTPTAEFRPTLRT